MRGVGPGSCLPVCSVGVRMEGVLSVSVYSSVLGRPVSASDDGSASSCPSFAQPASVSVNPLPALEQSVAASWKLCQRRDQRPDAAATAACNRQKTPVPAPEAGDGLRRAGRQRIWGNRRLMPQRTASAQIARCATSAVWRYLQRDLMASCRVGIVNVAHRTGGKA